MNRESVHSF
uniref:Uncharacterized protein n=1 Tax=Anguilla anguilla TaxID=7936 RepID=A0A0E9VI05_ANGAN